MSISKWLGLATLVGAAVAGSACAQDASDRRTNEADTVADAAKRSSDDALDATRDGANKAIDATADGAAAVGRKTEEVLSATGEAITDGWITTKVSASFVDESLLKGSDINVDTDDHVVTLKGTVRSDAARTRAASIARSVEGVTRVTNQLVVRVP